MRASVFIATSLDGYIARPDGGLDWLPGDDCEEHGYEAFMATVDALVIGRNTFETVLGFPGWPYGPKPVFVLSRTRAGADLPPGAVCEFMAGDPAEVAAALEARGFTHLYVDGGLTITGFLEAGLIQRMVITRIPSCWARAFPSSAPCPGTCGGSTWPPAPFPAAWCRASTAFRAEPARGPDGRVDGAVSPSILPKRNITN